MRISDWSSDVCSSDLAFQYPVEIPGVANATFLRSAVNAVRKHRGLADMDAMTFLKTAKAKMKQLQMDEKFLQRAVNVGFSGGEKKRNEVLQMLLLGIGRASWRERVCQYV